MEFEWDPRKADANLKKHGVSFTEAAEAFYDPNAIDDLDEGHSSPEQRFHLIGMSYGALLFVAYTVRPENRIRIISARKPTRGERRIYEQAKKTK